MKTASADSEKEILTKSQKLPCYARSCTIELKVDMTTQFPNLSAGSYLSFDRIDSIISKLSYAELLPFIDFSALCSEKYHSRFHTV